MQFHCIIMRYSLEPREYLWNDMDLCLLLEVWVINMERNLLITLKKSATDAVKTASKRAIQKTAEATSDLIGNKIADKITSVFKKKSNNNNNDDVELATHRKRYISPEERQQIIDKLRLVPRNY